MMKTSRDFPSYDRAAPGATKPSSLQALVDNRSAAQAAARLYRNNLSGLRYCCDSRELLTVEEALARDARETARRARKPHANPDTVDPVEMFHEEIATWQSLPTEIEDADEFDREMITDENHLVDLDDVDLLEADGDELEMFDTLLEDELDTASV